MNSESSDAERAQPVSPPEISEKGLVAHAGSSPAPPVAGGGPIGATAITTPSGGVTQPAQPPPGFGKGVNDYLNHYVTVADAKAGAILAANLAVAAALLDNRPAVELPFSYQAALAFAVINRHFDVADFLLEHGANINTDWNSHEPASILHHLVFLPNPYESVQFLIDRGIDMQLTDYRWNSTAAGWARFGSGDEKMARWLEEAERQPKQVPLRRDGK